MAVEPDYPLARRARAIWGYAVMGQDDLAKRANIDPGRFKSMMGRTRTLEPDLEEVVRLARAVGVPRVFAERGFEGLWDPSEELLQDVADLKEDVSRLATQVGELVVGDAEAQSRIEALERTIRDFLPPPPA
jgi:hypothetical protein